MPTTSLGDDAGAPAEVALAMVGPPAPVVLSRFDADGTLAGLRGPLLDRLGLIRETILGHHYAVDLPDAEVICIARTLDGEPASADISLQDRDWAFEVRPVVGGGAVAVFTDDDETVAHDQALGRPTDDYFPGTGRARSDEVEEAVRTRGYWQGESELHHFGTGESIPVSVNSFLVTSRSTGELSRSRPFGRRCGVMQRSLHRHHFVTVSTTEPAADGLSTSIDPATVSGVAVTQDCTTTSDDLNAERRFRATTEAAGTGSALSSPVPGSDGAWGVVEVVDAEPRGRTGEDVAFRRVRRRPARGGGTPLGAGGRAAAPGSARPVDRPAQPGTGPGPDRACSRPGPSRRHPARRPAARPRRLQGGQRLARTQHRRPASREGGHSPDRSRRPGDTVARLGGDELVVLCEDVRTDDEVAFLAEAVLAACSTDFDLAGRTINFSASVGVAVSAGGAGSTTGILGEADIAMYRAKRDRPGTYRTFDEAMRGEVVGRLNTAGELRSTLRGKGLDIAYQPIISLATGRIAALEALARWTTPSGTAVSPEVFIPVAEETGLIGELGSQILRKATLAAATWQGIAPTGVRVNVSGHEIRSRTFYEDVMRTLEFAGLDPALLGLEITESVLVEEGHGTEQVLTRLRDAGVTLMLDDFGTGYSSLSYLQRFPVVDMLKIDRSFLTDELKGEAVIQAVIGLGRAFGMKVCAEGVENAAQHGRVATLGCDHAQGYYFARPIAGDMVPKMLETWAPFMPA